MAGAGAGCRGRSRRCEESWSLGTTAGTLVPVLGLTGQNKFTFYKGITSQEWVSFVSCPLPTLAAGTLRGSPDRLGALKNVASLFSIQWILHLINS